MATIWPFMAKRRKKAEKCYKPVDVLSNPVVLSRFEGL